MNTTKRKETDNVTEKSHVYELVSFIRDKDFSNCENDKDKLEVDIVPTFWIRFDHALGSLVTPFRPPPYTNADLTDLNRLVKNLLPPPGVWPEYPVDLRGHAKTYGEALKKIKQLETKKYVYTSDETKTPQEISAAEAKKICRAPKIKTDFKKQDKILFRAPHLLGIQANKSLMSSSADLDSNDYILVEGSEGFDSQNSDKKQLKNSPAKFRKQKKCDLSQDISLESDQSADESGPLKVLRTSTSKAKECDLSQDISWESDESKHKSPPLKFVIR